MEEYTTLKNNINNKKSEYKCESCDFKTKRYYDLERHYKSKLHQRQGKPKTTKCDECDYVASTHWLIKKHKIVNHSSIEQRQKQKYYCDACDVVFFSPLYKDKHFQSGRKSILCR